MPSFLEQSRKNQEEKRARGEKDPADLSGSQEPNWDSLDSSDNGCDSASENAGEQAGQEQAQTTPPPKPPKGSSSASTTTRTPALRRGRPKGPARKMLSVRILPENDRKLTAAVEATGKIPQTIVDEALTAHFRRLKIADPAQEQEGPA